MEKPLTIILWCGVIYMLFKIAPELFLTALTIGAVISELIH